MITYKQIVEGDEISSRTDEGAADRVRRERKLIAEFRRFLKENDDVDQVFVLAVISVD